MEQLREEALNEPIRQATAVLRAHFEDAAALAWEEVRAFVEGHSSRAVSAGLESAKNFKIYMISAWSLRPGFPDQFPQAQLILQSGSDPDQKANKLYRWTMNELSTTGKS
jgi:hypothetical protein